MTTFSQLVDKMTMELLRPDLKESVASYVNQTVREIHFIPGTQSPAFFEANRKEDLAVVNSDGSYFWPIPVPATFQNLEAIYNTTLGCYHVKKSPSVMYRETDQPGMNRTFYRSGSTVAISGVGAGQNLLISWFEYVRSLRYQPAGSRTVTYDEDAMTYSGTEAEQELATHWLLNRWPMVIEEGVRAKVWKRLGDDVRGRTAYSAFESMRRSLWEAEPSVVVDP